MGYGALALLLAVAFATHPAFGQRGGGGGGRTASISGRYFSGKVALEDGSPPPEPAVIESKCSMTVRKEATTDKKGGFGFNLGQGRSDLIGDMSASRVGTGGVLDANGGNCTITARLSGYTSDPIDVSQLPSNQVDLGVLTLHKAADNPMVSATSRKAPKDAVKAFDKGRDAAKNKRWEDAAKNFQKAVDLYPDYAEAWYELGQAQIGLKQLDEAHKSLEAAIKADGKYLPPYNALLAVEGQNQNWKAVAQIADRIIELSPKSSPGVYFLCAAAQFRLQNLDAAEKRAQEGIKLDEGHTVPKLFEALAEVQAARGDLAGAADQLKQYLQFSPFAPDAATVKAEIADLESGAAAQPKQ
jgi:tetratricopeptide (TPR) repeat protein